MTKKSHFILTKEGDQMGAQIDATDFSDFMSMFFLAMMRKPELELLLREILTKFSEYKLTTEYAELKQHMDEEHNDEETDNGKSN